MRQRSVYALLAVPVLVAVMSAAPDAQAAPRVGSFTANLTPLNQDGMATVTLTQQGTALTVHLQASGLNGGVHLAHLHGVKQAENECPTLALDRDGNGLIDLAEGVPAYGPVQVTLSQGTNDRGTSLDYTRTYKNLDSGDGIASLGALDQYVVVVHGVDLTGDGLATNPDVQGDGADPDDSEITMPAVCGVVQSAH